MNFFNKIRSLFGINDEVSNTSLDQLDIIAIEQGKVQDEIAKANAEFDDIDQTLSLKIAACNKLIEKGVKEGADNKKFLVNRLDRITTAHLELIKGLINESRSLEKQKVEVESELIIKAVEVTAGLSDDNQKQIKIILDVWDETGIIKGEEIDSQARAITLAIEEIVKGGEGSRGGKVIGHTRSGKAIYDKHNHPSHKDFTKEDHEDAVWENSELSERWEQNSKNRRGSTTISEVKAKVEATESSIHYKTNAEKHSEASREIKKSEPIEKGGEGSKGGKIIGHTKSGKAIYQNADHPSHKDFTHEDHNDAQQKHTEIQIHHSRRNNLNFGPRNEAQAKEDAEQKEYHGNQNKIHQDEAYKKHPARKNDEIKKSHEPVAIELAGTGDVEYDSLVEGHYANVIVRRTFKEGEKDVSKILFLKRASTKVVEPNKFCLPGGHIDEGETIEVAALRELKEEAHLDASSAYILGKAKCEDGKWAFYLSAYPQGDVMLLDGESVNAAWMSAEEWLEADLLFDLKDHLVALETSTRELDSIPDIMKGEGFEKAMFHPEKPNHKYIRREGSAGNYTYLYDSPDQKSRDGKSYREGLYSSNVKPKSDKEPERLTPKAEKFLETIRISDRSIQLKDITVEATAKGNWVVYDKGKLLMVVNSKMLDDDTIRKYELEHHVNEENELEKGGEGSKGGKIIGHTKSGKPIYSQKRAHDYEDFSHDDHRDAADLHKKLGVENPKRKSHHSITGTEHFILGNPDKFNKAEEDDIINPFYEVEEFQKAFDDEELIKGRAAGEGEERTWGGKKYKKSGGKWIVVGSGKKKEGDNDLVQQGHAAFKEASSTKSPREKMKLVDKAKGHYDEHAKSLSDEELVDHHKKASAGSLHQAVLAKHLGERAQEKIDKEWSEKGGSEEKGKAGTTEQNIKKLSTKQLKEHVENTSTDQLKKVAEKQDHPHNDAAKRELERRGEGKDKLSKEDIPSDVHDIVEGAINGDEDVNIDEAIDKLHKIYKSKGKEFDEKRFLKWVKNEQEDGGQGRMHFSDEVSHSFEKKGKEKKEKELSLPKAHSEQWFDKNKDQIKKKLTDHISENLSTSEAAEALGYDEEDVENVDETVYEDLANEWAGDYGSFKEHLDQFEDIF